MKGLGIYAPHATGFVLLALPVVIVTALAQWLLGAPPVIAFPIGLVGILSHAFFEILRQRPERAAKRRT